MRESVENPMVNYREVEPKVVAHCCNCNEALTEQDTFIKVRFDHYEDYFCNDECFLDYSDITEVEGHEI